MGVPLEPGFLQIAGHEIGRQARDLGQLIAERLLVEAGRGNRDDPRDPAARHREADKPGDVRVLFHITVVGGLMSVEPPALAWMRSRAPFEREQAGGRLGQRGDDEPAARPGVGADLPPAHRGRRLSAEFRVRAKLYRLSRRGRQAWASCGPTANCFGYLSSPLFSWPRRPRWRRRRSPAWPWGRWCTPRPGRPCCRRW